MAALTSLFCLWHLWAPPNESVLRLAGGSVPSSREKLGAVSQLVRWLFVLPSRKLFLGHILCFIKAMAFGCDPTPIEIHGKIHTDFNLS